MSASLINQYKSFGGWQKQYTHQSQVLDCTMRFSVYFPPAAETKQALPVVYWLSGLTCTDENFVQKAGAQRAAAELGMVLVAPDTSPRGDQVADDAEGAYDLGLGAGFYVNATQAPWSRHYQMYDYVVSELPQLAESLFEASGQRAISGHSMGGHGALTIGLKHPDRYSSVTAFSPICNPSQCPWGEKAFGAYLGQDRQAWRAYDAAELMAVGGSLPVLVDQGDADQFLSDQLMPQALQSAATQSDYPLTLRMQMGYDHSYFFIASFIDDHLRFHCSHWC